MRLSKAYLGILASAGLLALVMTSNAATAVANAAKDVIVANTASQPVPVAVQGGISARSSDVTTSTDISLDETAHQTLATVDVSRDRSVRVNLFMECVTVCAPGTRLVFTISENSGGGSFVIAQIIDTVQEQFHTTTYEVPGVTWNIALFSDCHCAAALIKVLHRSN